MSSPWPRSSKPVSEPTAATHPRSSGAWLETNNLSTNRSMPFDTRRLHHGDDRHHDSTSTMPTKHAGRLMCGSTTGEDIIHQDDMTPAYAGDRPARTKGVRPALPLTERPARLRRTTTLSQRMTALESAGRRKGTGQHAGVIDPASEHPARRHRDGSHEGPRQPGGRGVASNRMGQSNAKCAPHRVPAIELHRTNPVGKWRFV